MEEFDRQEARIAGGISTDIPRPRRYPVNVKLRPLCNKDVPALVELVLQAFVPIFESFPRILGDSIYQKIWPDWEARASASERSAPWKRQSLRAVIRDERDLGRRARITFRESLTSG